SRRRTVAPRPRSLPMSCVPARVCAPQGAQTRARTRVVRSWAAPDERRGRDCGGTAAGRLGEHVSRRTYRSVTRRYAAAMSDYRPSRAELDFVLNHVVDLGRLARYDAFRHADPDTVRGVLEEAGRFAAEVLAPLNRVGDLQGSQL